jgi:hypothetical protein
MGSCVLVATSTNKFKAPSWHQACFQCRQISALPLRKHGAGNLQTPPGELGRLLRCVQRAGPLFGMSAYHLCLLSSCHLFLHITMYAYHPLLWPLRQVNASRQSPITFFMSARLAGPAEVYRSIGCLWRMLQGAWKSFQRFLHVLIPFARSPPS